MRLTGILVQHFLQNKFILVESALLIGCLTALCRVDDTFASFVFGVTAGYLLFRLGDRIAKRGASKA
ncbi:hypothetical protein CLV59_111101 [Chitinophaga dinghuensis]|uniref:Uncharacterized protein n=1 Tax=Chitinophaga dinghuensis TaxID=1539050 RepID=A0A327VIQ9_9BACT|nr:hypothetical protein [Chitinophaga dinghuensis]RAJ73982.1 hypothetical protein CLV59_111101 [Chitinophaga dinghuensis]